MSKTIKGPSTSAGDQWTKEDYRKIYNKIASVKDKRGRLRCELFEELPDAQDYPDYYEEIDNPIALDMISKKIDGNKYKSIEDFVADFELMFENAQQYNADGSPVYKDATFLQNLLQKLVYGDETGSQKSQVSESEEREGPAQDGLKVLDNVSYKNEKYSVGDCVKISSDESQELGIGQIFKVWQDKRNKRGIEICIYIHPAETEHPPSRKFYEHELLKTDMYKNYPLESIASKCYILPVNHYIKGRPRNAGTRDVYVCESRYDRSSKTITKIKDWNTCVPVQCRGKQPDLELFPNPLSLKKVSPGETVDGGDENGNASQQKLKKKRKRDNDVKMEDSEMEDTGDGSVHSGTRADSVESAANSRTENMRQTRRRTNTTKSYDETEEKEEEEEEEEEEDGANGMLPKKIVQSFQTAPTKSNNTSTILWFSAPPVDPVSVEMDPIPSLEYLVYKRKQAEKLEKNGNRCP
ncbi:hypothetical protein BKA69DRAFT_763523 [Paraphysoderma sedebokerense]|nr:hypothetical protein BKA69DRAFT_763523 [Paraphysoderma sedebokerense]